MSVFRLDHGLQAVEPFTNDRELLREAIERVTAESSTSSSARTGQLQRKMDQLLGPDTGDKSMEQRVDEIVHDDAERQMMKVMLGMVRTDERMDIGRNGFNVLFPLLAAVRGQSSLPGRKSVLFFSPGFAVPYEMEDNFKSILEAASRNNVTFFAIDTQGLETIGANASSVEQLKGAGRASMDHAIGDPTTAAVDVMAMDTAANSGKYNTQDTLARSGRVASSSRTRTTFATRCNESWKRLKLTTS